MPDPVIFIHVETLTDRNPYASHMRQSYGKSPSWFRVYVTRQTDSGDLTHSVCNLGYTRAIARCIKRLIVSHPDAICLVRENWTNNPL